MSPWSDECPDRAKKMEMHLQSHEVQALSGQGPVAQWRWRRLLRGVAQLVSKPEC